MKANNLFKLGAHVYKAIPSPDGLYTHCAAFNKNSLCIKMPFCGSKGKQVYFKRLTAYELKQANKQKINIKNL